MAWFYFSVWTRNLDISTDIWSPWRQLPGIGPQYMNDNDARLQHARMMGVSRVSYNVITQSKIGRYRWDGRQWVFEGWL